MRGPFLEVALASCSVGIGTGIGTGFGGFGAGILLRCCAPVVWSRPEESDILARAYLNIALEHQGALDPKCFHLVFCKFLFELEGLRKGRVGQLSAISGLSSPMAIHFKPAGTRADLLSSAC